MSVELAFDKTTETGGCPSGLAPGVAPHGAPNGDPFAAPFTGQGVAGGDATIIDPAPFVRRRDGVSLLELAVFGAKCAGCISKIESAMSALDGMERARLNLSTGRLSLTWRDGVEWAPKRITNTAS